MVGDMLTSWQEEMTRRRAWHWAAVGSVARYCPQLWRPAPPSSPPHLALPHSHRQHRHAPHHRLLRMLPASSRVAAAAHYPLFAPSSMSNIDRLSLKPGYRKRAWQKFLIKHVRRNAARYTAAKPRAAAAAPLACRRRQPPPTRRRPLPVCLPRFASKLSYRPAADACQLPWHLSPAASGL